MTLEEMQCMDFAKLCQYRSDLEITKREFEDAFEAAKKHITEVDSVLLERFSQSETTGHDTKDFHIGTKINLYASCPGDAYELDKVFAKNGIPGMGKMTINGNSLAAAVRDACETAELNWRMGQPDSFPDWIQQLTNNNQLKITVKPSISMRKK